MSASGQTGGRGTLPHGGAWKEVRGFDVLPHWALCTPGKMGETQSFSKEIEEPIKIVFQLSYKFEIVSKEEEKGGGGLGKHKRYRNYMSKCNALNNL